MKIVAIADALLPERFVKEGLEIFAEQGHQVIVMSWGEDDEEKIDLRARNLELNGPEADSPPEELDTHIAEADILVVHYCPVSDALLSRAPRLRILATCRMGTQNIDVAAATRRQILAFHVIGRTTEAVSDHTVGLLLCEARNIARGDVALKNGVWRKAYSNSATTPELENKTMGIVGFGEVGKAILRKLKGFNMKFMVYDPIIPESEIIKHQAQAVDLDTLLRQSDFVSLHAAVSDRSKGMIGPREFDLMKPIAFFINTARSELVDEDALYAALADKRIAGAAMDVFKNEPLPADHPFTTLDNITLTPHIASSTLECLAKSPRLLADEITHFFETGASRFILNPGLFENCSIADFKPR